MRMILTFARRQRLRWFKPMTEDQARIVASIKFPCC